MRMQFQMFAAALLLLPVIAAPGVRLEVPKSEAWTGQRLPFFIELRAGGSFTGTAAFDLPQVPGTVILKIGNPVIGSSSEGDTEVFTQRHEFAVFSQAAGSVEIPPVTVRFSHKKGFTGASFDESFATDAATLTIRRPPGTEPLGFLVTTAQLAIEERWDPPPGPLATGAVLKRTIIQRAPGMTGIAFAPAPATAPEGIRVYVGQPQVTDHSERGQLTGERLDTITYLVQQPGLHELPAIRYDWWNPETEQLESKTLPAVSFTATAPPAPSPKPSPARWLAWLPVLILAAATIAFRKRLRSAIHRLRDRIDPPSRRAARAFLHACGRSDPDAALSAWARFRSLERDFTAPPELARQLDALFRTRFGPGPSPADWHGDDLSRAFRASRKADASHPRSAEQLPPLNPASHR